MGSTWLYRLMMTVMLLEFVCLFPVLILIMLFDACTLLTWDLTDSIGFEHADLLFGWPQRWNR